MQISMENRQFKIRLGSARGIAFKRALAIAAIAWSLFLSSSCSQNPQKLIAAGNRYHAQKNYKSATILYEKALLADKKNAEAYYRLGLTFYTEGDFMAAAGPFRRAVDLQPRNADAAEKLALIYWAAYSSNPRKYHRVLSDLRNLANATLKNSPGSFEGLRIQGLSKMGDADYEGAATAFAAALKLKPDSHDTALRYGFALLQEQRRGQAIAMMQSVLAREKKWALGYDFFFSIYRNAEENKLAEDVLRQHVHADPASAEAVTSLANFLVSAHRYAEAESVIRTLLDDKKRFPASYDLVAEFYLRHGHYDESLREFQLGEKEDPAHALQYQEGRAKVLALSGNTGAALAMARDLSKKDARNRSASELYASLLLETGRSNALEEISRLVAANPAIPALHVDLGRAYYASGNQQRALREFLEAIQAQRTEDQSKAWSVDFSSDDQKTDGERREEQDRRELGGRVYEQATTYAAEIHENRGEYGEAALEAERVLSSSPFDWQARLLNDRALIGMNQVDKALADLQYIVKTVPSLADAKLTLGTLYVTQRQFDKALEQFQAVYQSKPPDMRGFLGIQTVKVESGQAGEALQSLQAQVTQHPGDLFWLAQLADLQLKVAMTQKRANGNDSQQLLRQAAANFRRLLKTGADLANIWVKLGNVDQLSGEQEQALASYETAGNIDPKNLAAFLNRGLLNQSLGRTSEAMKSYRKTIMLDPNNVIALNNLAFLMADKGENLDKALSLAEHAQKLTRTDAHVLDTLGYVYYKKGLYHDALSIFRENVARYPQNASYHRHLEMALLGSGDRAGASQEERQVPASSAFPARQNESHLIISPRSTNWRNLSPQFSAIAGVGFGLPPLRTP
jgi:tetratricopeptide (TPR) repeat protein